MNKPELLGDKIGIRFTNPAEERWWVVATSCGCCGCYREGLILFVVCGYRGFGSARVHWGLTYLPTTHICELRTFAFKPQPSRVVQLTW